MKITKTQAEKLGVTAQTNLSPYLENCSLILSANESYSNAEKDLKILTGMQVSKSSHQRLVQRTEFKEVKAKIPVQELSVDGGKVRLRTAKGQPSEWRDYKAVNLHQIGIAAAFQDNPALIEWVNEQPLSTPLICLGDGHSGIWNLISNIDSERQEILDWFHLIENLNKIGGSNQRLEKVKTLLWQGKVQQAIEQFDQSTQREASNFVKYLEFHRSRIPNYSYLQAEGFSIGSGAIESAIKQISARVKITGAQWNKINVPQVLRHRTAYLNGALTPTV